MYALDSLKSLVGQLGRSGGDPSSDLVYTAPMFTDKQLSDAYRSSWMAKKIVKIPADDATRNWRDWQATNKQIELIEATEDRLDLQLKIRHALRMARLYGGAIIYMHTTDNDVSSQLDVESIGRDGLRHITVLTRRQVDAGELDTDPLSPFFGTPREYYVHSDAQGTVTIHPSRVVRFVGEDYPDQTDALHNVGWGDSVLAALYNTLLQSDGTAANIARLIFEAKVDVIKYPELSAMVSSESGLKLLLSRFQTAAQLKENRGFLLLDSAEEYEQKQISFATMPEVLKEFLQLVSGAADIPATRFLGQTPSGLNSTGESDLRNYYDKIRSIQKLEISPAARRLDELVIRSALGERPPEIHYVWASLWQITDKERAEIGEINARASRYHVDSGLIPTKALADSVINQAVEMSIFPGLEAAVAALPTPSYPPLPSLKSQMGPDTKSSGTAGIATDAAPRTLYVRRDVLNSEDIIRWARSQGFVSTLAPSDLHVTVIYSRVMVDWMKMGEPWRAEMVVPAGGPRVVERFARGAVVLSFSSNELDWRHSEMVRQGASSDYENYQPHITFAYDAEEIDVEQIEPYTGEIRLGPEIFEKVRET